MTTKPKWTATDIIRNVLTVHNTWLAVHQITTIARQNEEYISDNAAATRLSELASHGEVEGRIREGCRYKEWRLAIGDDGEEVRNLPTEDNREER